MEASSSSAVVSATPTPKVRYKPLFMFVRRPNGRYLLYKLNVTKMRLRGRQSLSTDSQPLIVFKRSVLPKCECAFAFIEPKFYIVGEDEIFTLDKHKLLDLKPSKSSRGIELVKPLTTPMLGKKSNPLAFAYNNKLYVLSKGGSDQGPQDYSFEVYCPSADNWTDLYPKPLWQSTVKAHVILDTFVYFTMSNECVMSFNLRTSKWSTVYDPFGVLYIYKHMFPQYIDPPPTFDSDIQVIGNAIIGSYCYTPGMDPCSDIFASTLHKPFEEYFLRPVRPMRFPISRSSDGICDYSRCILNYKGSLCLILYCSTPVKDRSFINFAEVTFYDLSNECPTMTHHFHFTINSGRKFSHGTISSCIFA